jgi:hypothetical protein
MGAPDDVSDTREGIVLVRGLQRAPVGGDTGHVEGEGERDAEMVREKAAMEAFVDMVILTDCLTDRVSACYIARVRSFSDKVIFTSVDPIVCNCYACMHMYVSYAIPKVERACRYSMGD